MKHWDFQSGRHFVGDNTNKVEKIGYTSRRFFVGENTNKGERAHLFMGLKNRAAYKQI